jgi:hypothetical protein
MNLSLMSCHMIRVISSPSISTTGFLTLIFCGVADEAFRIWDGGVILLDSALRRFAAVVDAMIYVRARREEWGILEGRMEGCTRDPARGKTVRSGFIETICRKVGV